jgi:wobble nucleotide-excising tRNase
VSFEASRQSKKVAEKAKDAAKNALDDSSTALFAKYQDRINNHLANSACGYSIVGTKTSFAGGKPRTEYQLKINGKSIDLVAPKSTTLAPCFRNTLSDGDRSALALAFFLARLDLDPDIANKIVVVDDPMTSLDAHRRAYTCEQVALLSTRALQVVVLTHDSMFAADIWDRLATPKTALKIAANGSHSEIVDWDIGEETASDYFRRCRTLLRCVNGEKGLDLTAAATSIRLVLEGNLRMRFPADLPSGKWLGSLIEAIRDSPAGSNLEGAKKHLAEIIALNEYSKKYHHDGTPGVVVPVPALAELQSYSRRTLAFIQGV